MSVYNAESMRVAARSTGWSRRGAVRKGTRRKSILVRAALLGELEGLTV